MMIKAKPLPVWLVSWGSLAITRSFFWWRYKKLVINNDFDVKPGHSYILMLNHFGFIDGFFAYWICFYWLNKKQKVKNFYMMSVKRQMEKNWWLKFIGSFSVEPGKRSVNETLDYAASLMNEPGNVLLYFPQGNLESLHVRHIEFKEGLYEIARRTTGDCQLIWCSNIIEYFESVKPTAYLNMLDCGTTHEFDFDGLKEKINTHHKNSFKNTVRFTELTD
jgi:1-acyl-sn-glycerol-3-phosphate acyltransferase